MTGNEGSRYHSCQLAARSRPHCCRIWIWIGRMCDRQIPSKLQPSDDANKTVLKSLLYECFKVHNGRWVCASCLYALVMRCIVKLTEHKEIESASRHYTLRDMQDILRNIIHETKDKEYKLICVPKRMDELYCVTTRDASEVAADGCPQNIACGTSSENTSRDCATNLPIKKRRRLARPL